MADFYHHHQHPAHAAPVFAPPHPLHRPARPAPLAPAPRYRSSSRVPRVPRSPELDPVLAYHSNPSHVALDFDVSLSPSQITLGQGHSRSSSSGLSPRHLVPPATNPPLPFLRIKCHVLPWSIDVHPSAHSGVVTVGDVLNTIYHSLRHHAREAEWRAVSVETQEGVRGAWRRRCRRQRTHKDRAYEESQGLRRIDWLMRHTMFQGLTPGRSPDQWVMHIGSRSGERTVRFAMGS